MPALAREVAMSMLSDVFSNAGPMFYTSVAIATLLAVLGGE